MADQVKEFKALTFINLPFTERRFAPGAMIDRSEIEEYVEAAKAAHTWPAEMDETHSGPPDTDDVIAEFIKWGSLSEDPDAPLHPDHLPVEIGKPTLAQMVEMAQELRTQLEERGQPIPEGLHQMADLDYQHVVANGDSGSGGDTHVS